LRDFFESHNLSVSVATLSFKENQRKKTTQCFTSSFHFRLYIGGYKKNSLLFENLMLPCLFNTQGISGGFILSKGMVLLVVKSNKLHFEKEWQSWVTYFSCRFLQWIFQSMKSKVIFTILSSNFFFNKVIILRLKTER
jgi:hypothetical protein